MKKKYLAIILGMTLSITSMSTFADEETDAQEDVVTVEEAEDAEEMTGRIDAVNEDGSVLISIGEMTEDEADEMLGTLNLSGEELEAGFSEDVSAVGLVEYKTITVVEANDDENADEEESSEEVSDVDDEEITDSDTTDADVNEEDEDSDTAEESISEDADAEDEDEVETEEILTTDLETGDIITFTVDENGDINTVILIGVDVDILDEAEVSDAAEEDVEETSSDTEA
ncbi:MAG: hypothetical protein LUF78_06765 [Clostridiales bacterium]|nr:hypothetical protein [Clostridiales bacterium]